MTVPNPGTASNDPGATWFSLTSTGTVTKVPGFTLEVNGRGGKAANYVLEFHVDSGMRGEDINTDALAPTMSTNKTG